MRRRSAEKRPLIPDVRYNSELVARLINTVMERGKKSVAQGIVYGAFDLLKERNKEVDPLELFLQALESVKPRLEVKSRRVGGATYQVPMEVEPERKLTLAVRWILDASSARAGKSYAEKLAGEVMDAANEQGSAIRKREETHKMAEANRAFSHFRV